MLSKDSWRPPTSAYARA